MYLPQWKIHAKVARVSDTTPTPEQARAALAEADVRTYGVRRSDSQFRFILLALAATYVALGVVFGIAPHGGPPAGAAVLGIVGAGILLMILLFRRVRAWSKPGVLRFALCCAAFTIWNMVVLVVSDYSGWWFGPQTPSWHFTVTTAVASIPLVVAALLLAPRRP
jgi:hypothetical protein